MKAWPRAWASLSSSYNLNEPVSVHLCAIQKDYSAIVPHWLFPQVDSTASRCLYLGIHSLVAFPPATRTSALEGFHLLVHQHILPLEWCLGPSVNICSQGQREK